ncbi:MAG: hypothetical protein ACRCZK_01890 [Oscillospiraceae bacterium]
MKIIYLLLFSNLIVNVLLTLYSLNKKNKSLIFSFVFFGYYYFNFIKKNILDLVLLSCIFFGYFWFNLINTDELVVIYSAIFAITINYQAFLMRKNPKKGD